MTTILLDGPRKWSLERDVEGYRTYKLRLRVMCDPEDGPLSALLTPGLPLLGTPWVIDNDLDLWVWCTPQVTVEQEAPEGEPNTAFDLDFTFSNKPPQAERQRCNDSSIEDPLLEPPKTSGSFINYTEEGQKDKFGDPIQSSSHERFTGPQNEWDAGRPNIRIEQNVASFYQAAVLPGQLLHNLNDSPLWGFGVRCVKLSHATWERKYHGLCYVYYTRVLEFDVNVNTFDRDLLDEGTKVLQGHWDAETGAWVLENVGGFRPNKDNPAHFMRAVDRNENPINVVLNGAGLPADTWYIDDRFGTGTLATGGAGTIHVEKYSDNNLLLLGIPTTL